ncbi:MAG TPA: pyridoxal-phosphate dependent enzyme [Dongiaceae bacterium]|nr:pyridoxal-phosphate dependent enzyme [Dongiaceae bacterium]
MKPYRNILETIGKTPLVQITRLDTGPCQLFLKLENQNPGGSIKDRIALSMIEAAERDGSLKPGGTLIEATAGNTGLGLALVASQKGYRLTLIIPDKMAQEKIFHLRALGADIRMTRSDVGKGHPEYYQDMAERLTAETPGAIYVNQFSNPANPLAHETGTGPEIWEQMEHKVDAVVVGVGSGGTLSGIGRYMRRISPTTKMILADPKGSVLAPLVQTGKMTEAGSWLVEGIGEDFVPPNCDLSLVSEAFIVNDAESFATARDLLRKEAILAGSSSGTLLTAALRYCRAQKTAQRVVTFVCDSGNKYLSKMFNDYWMLDQGLLAREQKGDLRDLIARRHADRATVTVTPQDSLLIAYQRMKLYEISQLPVLDNGKVAGIIDESDLLLAVYGHAGRYRDPVSSAMTGKIDTVQASDPLSRLVEIFRRDHAALVMDGGEFLGLVTRIDLLNHLRRSIA